MRKVGLGLFLGLLLVNSPASAGLFADDDARKQIQQLEAKVLKLEAQLRSVEEQHRQSISSLLDLQIQLETQATELRKLNGQNEEWVHSLQDVEKRQKDFYVDLDARISQLELNQQKPDTSRAADNKASGTPVGENKVFEAAYGLYKAENYAGAATAFRDFLRQFPQSVHEANVYYWMGNAYFLTRDYTSSLESYQNLSNKFQDHPRLADAMLNMAECQLALKNKTSAKKTLKQITIQFLGSDVAATAKKRLATVK